MCNNQGGEMKTKTMVILVAFAFVMAIGCSVVSAANPIPASNETSGISVYITANAQGSLKSDTDIVFTQGNGNLLNNPPLDANGEGQATIAYVENTVATSGTINYTQSIEVDTASQGASGSNLETVRQIDYSNEGDGDSVGMMHSSESILIEQDATATDGEEGCCMWGDDNGETLPASSVRVEAGSEVNLKEGSVNSDGSARTVSNDIDSGIEITYDVSVEGSGQTGNDKAVGSAEVFTEAIIMEGSGAEVNQTTSMTYEQNVRVNGLIQISMDTEYSSP